MLDYLLSRIPSLSITFLINHVHPTLFCLQHRSVTGKVWDGSDQGGRGGDKTKNGTSAQMTARSIKNGGSLGLLECFAEETPRRQEEMVDKVFGHQQLMWKKCVFYSRMGDADVKTPADRWVSVEKCTAIASLLPLAAWPVPHLTSVGSKFSDQREAASHH